jgi:small subunit ribosomal protein S1
MNLEMRVLEVDPIHRRIVLAVTSIPAEQPPRPETPSTIIPMEEEEGMAGIDFTPESIEAGEIEE